MNSGFVLFLNLIALSPVTHLLGTYSVLFLRIVQCITIFISVPYWSSYSPVNQTRSKLKIYLYIYFIFVLVAEIYHVHHEWLNIVKLFLHILYIISLSYIFEKITYKTFRLGILILLSLYVTEYLIYSSGFDAVRGFSFSNILDISQIKGSKYDMLDQGYTLQSVHIIPLLSLISLPYLQKKYALLIIGTVGILMIFSMMFTATISYIVACVFYFIWTHNKKIYNSKFLLALLFSITLLIVLLIIYYPEQVYLLTSGRATLWQQAVKLSIENPLFGISSEEFYSSIYHFFRDSQFSNIVYYFEGTFDFTSGSCHNNYLGVAMINGIPTGIFFIAFLCFLWNSVIKRRSDMIYLLPLLYMVIRGFGESGGIIGNSSANIEFIFDIYIVSAIFIKNNYNENRYNCYIK